MEAFEFKVRVKIWKGVGIRGKYVSHGCYGAGKTDGGGGDDVSFDWDSKAI